MKRAIDWICWKLKIGWKRGFVWVGPDRMEVSWWHPKKQITRLEVHPNQRL